MGWSLAEESGGESLVASLSDGKGRRGSCFRISLHSEWGVGCRELPAFLEMRAIQWKQGARGASRGTVSDFRFPGAGRREESEQPEQMQAKHQGAAGTHIPRIEAELGMGRGGSGRTCEGTARKKLLEC